VGDFNGDGKADLVSLIARRIGSQVSEFITVLAGKGDGTFSALPSVIIPAGDAFHLATQVNVGDFNGDGVADLILSGNFGAILLAITMERFGRSQELFRTVPH